MRRRLWVLGPAAGMAACGGAPGPVPSPPQAASAAPQPAVQDAGATPEAAPEAAEAHAAPPADSRVRFEPLEAAPAPDPLPHVEIKFPVIQKPIPLPKAPRYPVRVQVANWPLGKNGAGLQLSLDDHPPQVFTKLSEPIRLGQLVAEDQEIRPGAHRLFAVAVGPDGETVKPLRPVSRAPFATVRFHVGERGQPEPDGPRLFYSQPRGTYNGDEAADSVLVDFYVVGAELAEEKFAVEVTVQGRDGTWSTQLRRWQPLRVRGLASGDYRITLQLLDSRGAPVRRKDARVSRTITVNLDAPVSQENAP